MKPEQDITAIILAGGKSSRMGEDKGLMLFEGLPMVEHVINTVKQLTDKVIIIANDKQYEQFGVPVYEDIEKEKGPLAGIITGLSVSKTDLNWVISCDAPKVSGELLAELARAIEDYDAVVPVYYEKVHPLIATYRKSALNVLKEQLALNRFKVILANEALNVKRLNVNGFDEANFRNINTKGDL